MPRPRLTVAVEPPNSRPSYVVCRDVDDCLKVVAGESKRGRNVTGTRISIIEGKVLASWRIHGSGVRRETLLRRENEP